MATPINNQAGVTYTFNGAREPITDDSNIAVVNLLDAYGINVTKRSLTPVFIPGENVTYQLLITNTGTNSLTTVRISDNLGTSPYTTYVIGSATLYLNGNLTSIAQTSDNPLEFTLPSPLPSGETALLTYVVEISRSIPSTVASIINTVTVTGTTGESTTTNTASTTITPASYAEVSISKSSTSDTVSSGEEFSYTLTLSNYGNLEASITSITDSLPANFVISSIQLIMNGVTTTLSSTDYTLTGSLLTIPSATGPAITVPASTSGIPGTTMIIVTGSLT